MNAYLNFNDNCREAMNFYKDCLGGELTLQKVSDSPEMAAHMPANMADKILHSTLAAGPIIIMGSDLHRSKLIEGNTISLCLNCESEQEIKSLFSNLSQGGEVIDALADMPWNALFGSVIDKYGKMWLFNYDKGQRA